HYVDTRQHRVGLILDRAGNRGRGDLSENRACECGEENEDDDDTDGTVTPERSAGDHDVLRLCANRPTITMCLTESKLLWSDHSDFGLRLSGSVVRPQPDSGFFS